MNNRNVVMYPDDGTGAAAGGGAAGGAGAGAAGAAAGAAAGNAASGAAAGAAAGGAQGGGQQAAFADAASARTFLSEYVHDGEFLKGIPDDKVIPWAAKTKGRVDEFGKQFPADWRKLVAGDNAEHLKTLDRFQSPKALYESYNTLRAKLSSGELKPVTAFPDKGTADEQTAWRVANGVPEKAEGYTFNVPKGVQLSDEDKGILTSLQQGAHAKHIPAAHAQAFADWMLTSRQAGIEQRAERDSALREQSEDAMRSEWGGDYKANRGRIGALLDTGPKGIRDMLGKARLADGSLLGDNPEWLRFFASVSRQLIPQGVVLTEGADIGKSVDDEIASIEKTMRTDRKTYNKDEKMQGRYRELLGARDRLKGGAKQAA